MMQRLAFSAIVMVGVLVSPDLMKDITEASTTRNPRDAIDPQPFVHHRQRIAGRSHLRGSHRMEDGSADIARRIDACNQDGWKRRNKRHCENA